MLARFNTQFSSDRGLKTAAIDRTANVAGAKLLRHNRLLSAAGVYECHLSCQYKKKKKSNTLFPHAAIYIMSKKKRMFLPHLITYRLLIQR